MCNGRAPGHRTFLFFPLVDWHTRIQRSQHLARALADLGHLCIYVNPHLGLQYASPRLFSPDARLSALRPGLFELHVHLPAEHAIDSRCLMDSEAELIVDVVESLVQELGIRDAVQMVSLPSWLAVAKALRDRRGFSMVYDCHDYLSGFERLARSIVDAEAPLFEECDHVLFSAQYLMDVSLRQAPSAAAKAILLRNANRPEDFRSARRTKRVAPRPRVGYAGSLDHWFDVDLLAQAADARPDVDFILAGRIEDNRIRHLRRCPNVSFTGEIPYSSVPDFLQSCAAGMIPFRRSPLTLATNPIKLYEYFSAGLPVVSTRLPEVELYEDLVYIADNAEQFAAGVSDAVDETCPWARELRLATAEVESWENRARTLVDRVTGSEVRADVARSAASVR